MKPTGRSVHGSPRAQELRLRAGLLHPLLPHDVGPGTTGPVLHPSRVQDDGHREQGRVKLRGGAAETRTLTVVDVDAAIVLQVQTLVKANRGAVQHAAPDSPQRSWRVCVSLVAAVGLKL